MFDSIKQKQTKKRRARDKPTEEVIAQEIRDQSAPKWAVTFSVFQKMNRIINNLSRRCLWLSVAASIAAELKLFTGCIAC